LSDEEKRKQYDQFGREGIYQKVTAQKPGEPARQASAPGANPSKDDNVVDAEFREVKDEGSR